MEGIFEALKADPDAERKYFQTIYLEDWERKVVRNIKPVVNWPQKDKGWVGEPVAMLSAQIGYPTATGELAWTGHVFQSTDPEGSIWTHEMFQKAASDVQNAPTNWTPDKVFVKRTIHFTEPPNATEWPNVRCQIESNDVDLDPGENGSLLNDVNSVIRVDNVGALALGPIQLNAVLEGDKQWIEVDLQALGTRKDGLERPIETFQFGSSGQNDPRYMMVFTGQLDFTPKYRYRVRVFVKGTIFSKGETWEGPWTEGVGNGPKMIEVPMKGAPGVQTRAFRLGFDELPAKSGSLSSNGAPATAPVAGTAPPKPMAVATSGSGPRPPRSTPGAASDFGQPASTSVYRDMEATDDGFYIDTRGRRSRDAAPAADELVVHTALVRP